VAQQKIGLFGGTFNPIHFGHLNSIETILTRLDLDQVIVIPTSQNPLKPNVEGPTGQERLQMLQLALPSLGDWKAFVAISDVEVFNEGPSYTIETIKHLTMENPDAEYFWVMGIDQLQDFNRWKSYGKILEMVNVVVTSRPGQKLPSRIEALPPWLAEKVDAMDGFFATLKSGKTLQMIQMKDIDISATEIRNLARRDMDVSKFTPQSVARYIRQQNLYDKVGQKISDFSGFTKFCAEVLNSKGAINLQAYDVQNLEQPTDFTVVGSGTSSRHVISMVDSVSQAVKEKFGVYPQGKEGLIDGRWAILDYGGLMIHLFYDFVRNEYRIEDLWRAGKKLSL
jgi:nicotinate-nucleotide adenylyltransferase